MAACRCTGRQRWRVLAFVVDPAAKRSSVFLRNVRLYRPVSSRRLFSVRLPIVVNGELWGRQPTWLGDHLRWAAKSLATQQLYEAGVGRYRLFHQSLSLLFWKTDARYLARQAVGPDAGLLRLQPLHCRIFSASRISRLTGLVEQIGFQHGPMADGCR